VQGGGEEEKKEIEAAPSVVGIAALLITMLVLSWSVSAV
jgi:hypothetical protein